MSKLTLSLHLAYLEYIMAWGNFRKHALAESKLQINYLELKSWKFQKNYSENVVLVETGLLCGYLDVFQKQFVIVKEFVAPGRPVSLEGH